MTGGTQRITYPVAFTSAVESVSVQLVHSSQNYQSTAINANFSTSLTGCTIYSGNDASKFAIIAIGI